MAVGYPMPALIQYVLPVGIVGQAQGHVERPARLHTRDGRNEFGFNRTFSDRSGLHGGEAEQTGGEHGENHRELHERKD